MQYIVERDIPFLAAQFHEPRNCRKFFLFINHQNFIYIHSLQIQFFLVSEYTFFNLISIRISLLFRNLSIVLKTLRLRRSTFTRRCSNLRGYRGRSQRFQIGWVCEKSQQGINGTSADDYSSVSILYVIATLCWGDNTYINRSFPSTGKL